MSEMEINKKKAPPPKKTALGRGLGSLLGGQEGSFSKNTEGMEIIKETMKDLPSAKQTVLREGFVEKQRAAEPSIPETARIWNIQIDKIAGNPNQPRKVFEEDALKELAASIKEKGILQPIVVRKLNEGKFQIIAGERRWRAAQLAGLHEVPAILKNTKEQETLELALIENIQREDLNPIEEAEAYSQLMEDYGLTQQEVATKVGKERATVANILRLLSLAKEVRQMLSQEEISLGQAKVLLSVQDPKSQIEIAKKVKSNQLTVRETERLVLKHKMGIEKINTIEEIDVSKTLVKGLAEELQKYLGTRVNIDYLKGKGKISIYYYSDDELNQVTERLRETWQKSNR